MARKRFHGLQKVKLRATWSKYNLYNLTRMRMPSTQSQTYFQQKWAAKSATRAYHGEHVREKQWQRMFSRKLNSVVPMNAKYLAEFDGSEQAAGRGSGKDIDPREPKNDGLTSVRWTRTPYMHMTYAPLERRLDMALWRSLFASSARQARQMVIHGQVRVNGQKMPYPGYLLNPGDMFQVEPERVLYATGEMKNSTQAREGRLKRRAIRRVNIDKAEKRAEWRAKRDAAKAAKDSTDTEILIPQEKVVERRLPRNEEQQRKEANKHYQTILRQVREYMENASTKLRAKKKQEVRAYMKEVKGAVSQTSNKKIDVKTIEETLLSLTSRLPKILDRNLTLDGKRERPAAGKKGKASEAPEEEMSLEDKKKVQQAIIRLRENPVDQTKPYATPWRPRPYMSAFAFIPRYLEVNQNICAAVYLRHPVARPGVAEVPTPFGAETQQLAFNWYLKRR